MSILWQVVIGILSWVIVGFGQPAWSWPLGLIASVVGYALFWGVLLCYPNRRHRFWLGTAWFAAVQLVQLSWAISHPFFYIYPVYFLASLAVGMQFGVLSLLISPERLNKATNLVGIAAVWTLMEWIRLFFLSGFSFNPVGLALTGSIYSSQIASIWGIYGFSFWVILVNLFALRAWQQKSRQLASICLACAAIPYIYGGAHLAIHEPSFNAHQGVLTAVMVQPAFPIEENIVFEKPQDFEDYVFDEWKQIVKITKKHYGEDLDLIVLPEYIVPFGTYAFLYPYDAVKMVFEETLGPESVEAFPPLELPLAQEVNTVAGPRWLVNNAFWVQAIANCFDADVIVGLADAEDVAPQKREVYSAALHFEPQHQDEPIAFAPNRYEKRVLVPMAEYIPFSFCEKLAAEYGILGSFTPGSEAKVFAHKKLPFGLSICYEETFGDLVRESRQNGAELLVNVTSDVWFPNSRLPQQHFDHARLRTVENGVPLVRACNTGVTGAVDSLGRTVAILGDGHPDPEWLSDSIRIDVPTYHYQTLYSRLGDGLIIGFCMIAAFLFLRFIDK